MRMRMAMVMMMMMVGDRGLCSSITIKYKIGPQTNVQCALHGGEGSETYLGCQMNDRKTSPEARTPFTFLSFRFFSICFTVALANRKKSEGTHNIVYIYIYMCLYLSNNNKSCRTTVSHSRRGNVFHGRKTFPPLVYPFAYYCD